MTLKSKIVGLLIILAHCLANADDFLSWGFDQTNFVVNPTDTISLTATVTNSGPNPFVVTHGGAVFAGDFQKTFAWTPTINISGRVIPEYGTLTFDFGTLSPLGGQALPGTYIADPAGIRFEPTILTYAANSFVVTVVPEPGVVELLFVGIGLIWVVGRARAASRSAA